MKGLKTSTLIASTLLTTTNAFTTPTFLAKTCSSNCDKITQLYNVPPQTSESMSKEDIKSSADRQSPPQSFFELQQNCQRAAELAIADGFKLLEVEVSLCSYIIYKILHAMTSFHLSQQVY